MVSLLHSTNLALLQMNLEAEIEKPESEHTELGRTLDGLLNTSLHGYGILRWFIGLQIKNKMGLGKMMGSVFSQ